MDEVLRKEEEVVQSEDEVRAKQATDNIDNVIKEFKDLEVEEAVVEECEELPETYVVDDAGKLKYKHVLVLPDTHERLKLEKAKRGCKSLDELIRKQFGWE